LPEFVFCSDWHLARLTWTKRPEIVGDAIHSLRQVLAFAARRNIPIVAPGDLFDTMNPDPESVVGLLDAVRDAGYSQPIYYTQGQHERDPFKPWLSAASNAVHVHKKAFNIGGLKFFGLDWAPAGEAQENLANIPAGLDFLVTHQVWTEHMGSIAKTDASLADLGQYVPTILTGDYHVHQITDNPTPRGVVKLVSPGAISVRNLGELTPKAFSHWDGSQFVSIALNTRPVVEATIVDDLSFEQVAERALVATRVALGQGTPAEIAKPILKVDFPDTYGEIFQQRLPQLRELAHVFENRLSTAPEAAQVGQLTEEPVSLLGAVETALPGYSPQIRQNVARLLDSTLAPAAAIRELAASIESRHAAS